MCNIFIKYSIITYYLLFQFGRRMEYLFFYIQKLFDASMNTNFVFGCSTLRLRHVTFFSFFLNLRYEMNELITLFGFFVNLGHEMEELVTFFSLFMNLGEQDGQVHYLLWPFREFGARDRQASYRSFLAISLINTNFMLYFFRALAKKPTTLKSCLYDNIHKKAVERLHSYCLI